MKTAALDKKRNLDGVRVAHLFRTRKISVAAMDDKILSQIHAFPYPIQRLLADEATAVVERLAKGKAPPGMTVPECHCRFFTRYLVPCRHMFHEHIYGETKILTDVVWKRFQDIFEENGMTVYEHRELVGLPAPQLTEAEQEAERLRNEMNEITERLRDSFFRVLERGDNAETAQFLYRVKCTMNPHLNM